MGVHHAARAATAIRSAFLRGRQGGIRARSSSGGCRLAGLCGKLWRLRMGNPEMRCRRRLEQKERQHHAHDGCKDAQHPGKVHLHQHEHAPIMRQHAGTTAAEERTISRLEPEAMS